MAFPSTLFTQAQLQYALGGQDKLLQLADQTGTGDINNAACQSFIAEVQAAALGEVCAILQVAFDPADTTFTGSAYVQQNALVCGVYWAYLKGIGGLAVPDQVKVAHDEAVARLKEARAGMQSLATGVDPTSNAGAKTVTTDTTGTRILRTNMGGFS